MNREMPQRGSLAAGDAKHHRVGDLVPPDFAHGQARPPGEHIRRVALTVLGLRNKVKLAM